MLDGADSAYRAVLSWIERLEQDGEIMQKMTWEDVQELLSL